MTRHALLFACLLLAAPLAAQEPARALPPASPAPTAPVAAPTLAPLPANAVAVCNDQSVIVAPATPSGCATRGGVKVTLPGHRTAPTPEAVRPAPKGPTAVTPALRNDTPPAGATMRCRDGTWLTGPAAAARCDGNGGSAVILPAAPSAPAAPQRPPR